MSTCATSWRKASSATTAYTDAYATSPSVTGACGAPADDHTESAHQKLRPYAAGRSAPAASTAPPLTACQPHAPTWTTRKSATASSGARASRASSAAFRHVVSSGSRAEWIERRSDACHTRWARRGSLHSLSSRHAKSLVAQSIGSAAATSSASHRSTYHRAIFVGRSSGGFVAPSSTDVKNDLTMSSQKKASTSAYSVNSPACHPAAGAPRPRKASCSGTKKALAMKARRTAKLVETSALLPGEMSRRFCRLRAIRTVLSLETDFWPRLSTVKLVDTKLRACTRAISASPAFAASTCVTLGADEARRAGEAGAIEAFFIAVVASSRQLHKHGRLRKPPGGGTSQRQPVSQKSEIESEKSRFTLVN